jgi:hypothetical protein
MAKICLVICLITEVLFNENVLFDVCNFFISQWVSAVLGVTSNPKHCKRFNGGEYSVH